MTTGLYSTTTDEIDKRPGCTCPDDNVCTKCVKAWIKRRKNESP